MIITFDIEGKDKQMATFKAHNIGGDIGLPFEVVDNGTDDSVQLSIEIQDDMICKDFSIEEPFEVD